MCEWYTTTQAALRAFFAWSAWIKRWKCNGVDPLCWVCGKCRAYCDRDFGKGLSPILSHWTWYGQVLRSIVPKYRPPDYALLGVTRVTHSGLDGCWRALVQHHRFTKRRAITYVQTHVNPCRVASHSVAPQDIAGQAGDKPSLRCGQSAAILFVSTKAWGPLIVGLNDEGLFFFFWKYMSTVQRRKSGCRKGQPTIQHNPIPWGQGRSEGLRTGKGMGGTVQE